MYEMDSKHKTTTCSDCYLSGFVSTCSKRNSLPIAISCARAMSVTPFASRMTSSTLMNFGGEAYN